MYPGLGHVADAGVTGVTPGVSQGRVLDQQERGGCGAWREKMIICMFAVNQKQFGRKVVVPDNINQSILWQAVNRSS